MTDRDTINRVLAELVMGWHYDDTADEELGISPAWVTEIGRFNRGYWNPMDNIAQAMMVAEKLREDGKFVELHAHHDGDHDWTAHVVGYDVYWGADSASEAISRAAYEVVKGEQ